MSLEELLQVRLVLSFQALEIEDLAKVGVGFVGDVYEVGLDKGFGRGGAHLKRLEDGVDAGHGVGNAFGVADWRCWVGFGRGGEGEQGFEARFE